MVHVRVVELAGRQRNRISREQLVGLGLGRHAIEHAIASGALVAVAPAVFAIPPVLDDARARWKGATLTAPNTYLSRLCAASAWGFWGIAVKTETVVRPGGHGTRRYGRLLVHHSRTLHGETTTLNGVPITKPGRTLIDIAPLISGRALARCVREAVRLRRIGVGGIAETLERHRGRRGTAKLSGVLARYAGLPIERARSATEVEALRVLLDAGRPMPALNIEVAGVEADLVFPDQRLIIEIDGPDFHQDVGEDLRKELVWRDAGWSVRRIAAADIDAGGRLLLGRAPG